VGDRFNAFKNPIARKENKELFTRTARGDSEINNKDVIGFYHLNIQVSL